MDKKELKAELRRERARALELEEAARDLLVQFGVDGSSLDSQSLKDALRSIPITPMVDAVPEEEPVMLSMDDAKTSQPAEHEAAEASLIEEVPARRPEPEDIQVRPVPDEDHGASTLDHVLTPRSTIAHQLPQICKTGNIFVVCRSCVAMILLATEQESVDFPSDAEWVDYGLGDEAQSRPAPTWPNAVVLSCCKACEKNAAPQSSKKHSTSSDTIRLSPNIFAGASFLRAPSTIIGTDVPLVVKKGKIGVHSLSSITAGIKGPYKMMSVDVFVEGDTGPESMILPYVDGRFL